MITADAFVSVYPQVQLALNNWMRLWGITDGGMNCFDCPTENPDKVDKPCFEFICGCRVSFVDGLSILSGVFVTPCPLSDS